MKPYNFFYRDKIQLVFHLYQKNPPENPVVN